MPIEPIPPWVLERLTSVRLVLRSERMQARSMDLRVFVNQPRATERSKTVGNPRFAGSFGLFGMGRDHASDLKMIPRQENFDLELNITETIRQMSEKNKELSLKLVAVDVNGDAVAADQIDIDEGKLLVD